MSRKIVDPVTQTTFGGSASRMSQEQVQWVNSFSPSLSESVFNHEPHTEFADEGLLIVSWSEKAVLI